MKVLFTFRIYLDTFFMDWLLCLTHWYFKNYLKLNALYFFILTFNVENFKHSEKCRQWCKPSCSYHPALTSTFCQCCAKYLAFLFSWNNLKKVLDIVYVLFYINYAIIHFKCKYLLYSQIYEDIFIKHIQHAIMILPTIINTAQ